MSFIMGLGYIITPLLLVIIVLLTLLLKANFRTAQMNQLIEQLQYKQQELQASERAAKEFIADVSHEIHSTLGSVQNFANLLQQQELIIQQRIHYAKIVSEEAKQLSALCNQLLLLSHLNHSKQAVIKQRYVLKEQLRQVLQLFDYQLSSKQIMSTLKVSEQYFINANKVLMQQVWSNLLSNAIKHTPIEGCITIEVISDEQACLVTFADTGEGIAESSNAHLFDRFYRGESNYVNTNNGLGLSIAKKIIDLHEGDIQITSEKGKGTVVSVCLPQTYQP
jgi:signal transduction histidine kinase